MSIFYLVTGATGFIGSHVVTELVRRGDKVRCLDNQWRGNLENIYLVRSDIEFINGDIRDYETVCRCVKGVDCVLHLAAINGTEFFYTIPEIVLEVSVKGTMNIIDACIKHQVGNLVFMSSSEVYQTPTVVPTPETVPLSVPDPKNPRYSYGGGKIIGELLTLNYGRKHFQNVRIVRPHNVYGPRMGYEHVVPQFFLKLAELKEKGGTDFYIQGNGTETRSFVYIDDFVSGFLIAVEKGIHQEIYHVGTTDEISIRDLALKMAKIMNMDISIVPGKLTEGSTPRRCPDISKIMSLGYVPKMCIETGLKKTIDWYAENIQKKKG